MPTEVQIYKDGTVVAADIADKTITAAQIADTTITAAQIADTTITAGKLSTGHPNWDTAGNLTATSFKTSTESTGFLKANGTVDTNTYITQAVPAGAVFHFAASSAPTGYLKANGDTVPNGTGVVQGITANFSALYAILGSTYGAAGKLPDLRGEFIRGWADDRAVDTGRTFGSSQTDAMQGHKHNANRNVPMRLGSDGAYDSNSHIADANDLSLFDLASEMQVAPVTDGTNGTPRTAAETRPRNVALLACIKY